jgi:hypothetical protein
MTQKVIVTDTYCVDTSALIDFFWDYPPDVFEGLWKHFETAAERGRIIAPDQVFAELEQKDDGLLVWARKHRLMFRACDTDQVAEAQHVLRDFPTLVDPDKTGSAADPFVIALGKEGHNVVTSEGMRGVGGRPTIPSVCQSYHVRCIDLLELFRLENWRWSPSA